MRVYSNADRDCWFDSSNVADEARWVAKVQRGLDDIDAGRTSPLGDYLKALEEDDEE